MSPYGLHKKFCEEMLKFYGERDGLLGAVVRLFSIYGPGLRKQLLWDAVGKLLSGQAIFFGTGHEVRDWVHIDDTVRLIAIAADHASPKIPVCNGASGVAIPVRDILDLVARTLGVTQFPSFDGVSRLGDPDFLVGSTYAAKSWGWRVETNWRDGIAAYVRWAQNARKL
jgi:UDP-glucose 4-epimerase